MKSIVTTAVAVTACCALLASAQCAAGNDAEDMEWKRGDVQMSDKELQEKLTPEQYRVTQKDGTESAFENEYWDNHLAGVYVDVVSGEPLFASIHKFDSGSGWPSFTRPLVNQNIVEKRDRSWLMVRAEVRSAKADSHLGHLFEDGPAPTGMRYCVNSAALRFIPVEELEDEGYGEFLSLFGQNDTASNS